METSKPTSKRGKIDSSFDNDIPDLYISTIANENSEENDSVSL